MMKDILGEILDMKKGKAMTVTINIEPEKASEEELLKKQGLAPTPEKEEKDLEDESEELEEEDLGEEMPDKSVLMDSDEERLMQTKMKGGIGPKNLAERAKMSLLK